MIKTSIGKMYVAFGKEGPKVETLSPSENESWRKLAWHQLGLSYPESYYVGVRMDLIDKGWEVKKAKILIEEDE